MSAPMSEQRLAEILARVEAAAPGPWESDGAEFYGTLAGVLMIDLWVGETLDIDDLPQSEANAAFVAAARTDVPELVAEVQRLREERHSTNEALSDAAEQLRVQRDRIAELEAAAVCPSVARLHGSKCVLPVRHRGDHQNETRRHYWSDEHAVPAERSEDVSPQVAKLRGILASQRQQEDPHDGPMHQTFAVGRDLPEVTP